MILGEARDDPVELQMMKKTSQQGGDGGAYSDDGVEGDNEAAPSNIEAAPIKRSLCPWTVHYSPI